MRQQRWLDIFQNYDHVMDYVKASENITANAPRRRVDFKLKELCRQVPNIGQEH